MMGMKINHNVKIQAKTVIRVVPPAPPFNFETANTYAMFYPSGRYPGGIGGQTWRIMGRNGLMNGKPTYGYGDETISWNSTNLRWEMINVYQGIISFSSEQVYYPWEVNNWYWGDYSNPTFDNQVYVDPISP